MDPSKEPPERSEGGSRIRRTVYFSGRVQGVGFRYVTYHVARRFRVTGYVKNLPDGRVLAVAEGAPGEVAAFFAGVAEQMSANIRDAQQEDSPATGEFGSFEVRF